MTLNADIQNHAAHKQLPLFNTLAQSVLGVATTTSKAIGNFVTALQVSRMKGVLDAMSNEQLKMIDLERRDIAKHARFLAGR